jgi:CheY-like chemotaxis protein
MAADVRVLIVDDDVDFRAMLHFQLDQADGCTVIGDAADGYEALEQVALLQPEVVVVDLMMPGMDGFQLISRLRDEHPEVVPVAYSAMANEHARRQLAQVDVEMLTKSGSPEALQRAILRLTGPSTDRAPA